MLGKNILVTVILVLFAISSINALIACQQNTCDIVKCKESSKEECNKPNQELRKGGFCNCCTVCYTSLGENEQCPNLVTIGGPPPTVGCKKGLECIGGKCVKST